MKFNFEFKINIDDREPMRVHVWYQRREAIILLSDKNEMISLRENNGMNRGQIRQAMQLVGENQEFFILKWREIHG